MNARAEQTQATRRRRSDSYRGYDLRLDVPAHLKDPNYVYGWKNDEKGRLQRATQQDDWDYVTTDEMKIPSHDDGGFIAKNTNETDNRIRRVVADQTSARPIYAYLLKKRRDYFEADERERVRHNNEMRNSVIRSQRAGEVGETAADRRDFAAHSYVPGEVQASIDMTETVARRIKRAPSGRRPGRPKTVRPLPDREDGE
jgi:hypothetical protein